MQNQELVWLSVQLPGSLKRQARIKAAEENRSLSELVREAIDKLLQEREQEKRYATLPEGNK